MEYDLTDDERDALISMLSTEIEASRFPLSPRIQHYHRLLACFGHLASGDLATGFISLGHLASPRRRTLRQTW